MTQPREIVIVQGSNLIPWLSLGASAILALITLWYVILTSRILKQSQMVETARRQQQMEAQATQIAAWVSSSTVEARQVTVGITLLNPTSQAVYDVQVAIVDLNGGSLSSPPYSLAVLGPGDRRAYEVHCKLPLNAGGNLRANLTFVDGQGIKWRRNQVGALVKEAEDTGDQSVSLG